MTHLYELTHTQRLHQKSDYSDATYFIESDTDLIAVMGEEMGGLSPASKNRILGGGSCLPR